MPRLTGREEPVEVEIKLANGKVFHFISALGDTISMQKIETQIGKKKDAVPHTYYTLTLVEGRKDDL